MTSQEEVINRFAYQAERPRKNLFAIGGLGGSGTRAVAMLARNSGCWIGDDLNPALDNRAFTLMFKRASVLTDSDARLALLFGLFLKRLQGFCLAADEMEQLRPLALSTRFGHSAEWLSERLERLGAPVSPVSGQVRLGWKEPNTYIIIERLMRIYPDLSYVHVVRDPFYMAGSSNHNQLRNWGPFFFDRPVDDDPAEALSYWACVHARLQALQESYPGRFLFLSYDRLMCEPANEATRLVRFLGLSAPADPLTLFEGLRFQEGNEPPPRTAPAGCRLEDLYFCEAFMARLGVSGV